MARSSDSLRASERATAISTLIRQRHLMPSCGGPAPTAERTLGSARNIVESLTPSPGIREHNRPKGDLAAKTCARTGSPGRREAPAAPHLGRTAPAAFIISLEAPMKQQPQQMEPTSDDLYGGCFDIAVGLDGTIDLPQVRAAALFYRSILVPDGFFTARGPLFRHLQTLAERPDHPETTDEIFQYLQNGIVLQTLRKGSHISDVWFSGENVGFIRGRFLSAPIESGDQVFSFLRGYEFPFAPWPKPMAEARTTEFGSIVRQAFLNPIYSNAAGLEEIFSDSSATGWSRPDAVSARRLIEGFCEFIDANYQREHFRRGEIENFIGSQLSWDECFAYEKLYQRQRQDLSHAVAASIMETVSTVYELYQTKQFGCGVQLYPLNDPVVTASFVDPGMRLDGGLSIAIVELCPEIDFSKLTALDVLELRRMPSSTGDSLFDKACKLRRRVSETADSDSLIGFAEFCRHEYVPRILRNRDYARRAPVAGTTLDYSVKVADVATGVGIACLALGGLVITVVPILTPYVASLAGASTVLSGLGTKPVRRQIERISFVDRFFAGGRRRACIELLARDLSTIDRRPG